jgi:hypothetical protein
MWDYHVGVDALKNFVRFDDVWNRRSALEFARANPLLAPSGLAAAEALWHDFADSFQDPMSLTRDAARTLVLHNLEVDRLAQRGHFIVGAKVLTPQEALREVLTNSPLAAPLISLGTRFAFALLRTSGIAL